MPYRASVKSSARSLGAKRKGMRFNPTMRTAAAESSIGAGTFGSQTAFSSGDVGLRDIIRRVVNRDVEVKHVGQRVVDSAFNSTISASTECYRLLPDVTVGTAGHQRIGDRIRPKYLIVKGKLMYDIGMQGNYIPPSTVRLLILSQKNIKTSASLSSSVDVDHLLKDNIGTDVARPFNGTSFDTLAPINKELFTVHMDKLVPMRAQIEKQMGNDNTVLGYASQRTYTWTAKLKCPSWLTFDDGNINCPNNFAPFFCMGAVSDDNSGAFSVNTPYRATIQSELYFTDT